MHEKIHGFLQFANTFYNVLNTRFDLWAQLSLVYWHWSSYSAAAMVLPFIGCWEFSHRIFTQASIETSNFAMCKKTCVPLQIILKSEGSSHALLCTLAAWDTALAINQSQVWKRWLFENPLCGFLGNASQRSSNAFCIDFFCKHTLK